MTFPENMKHVLEVRDEEVLVPRAEVPGGHGGAGGQEVGGASGLAGGEAGAGERALRQMMGGTLAAREESSTVNGGTAASWHCMAVRLNRFGRRFA